MIDPKNFTKSERAVLAEIHAQVQRYKKEDEINKYKNEIFILRRLLLEAITCLLHHRRPNDKFMEHINKILRLEKLIEE